MPPLRLTAQPRALSSYWLKLPQLAAGFDPRICRMTRPAEPRHAERSLSASCRLAVVPTPSYDRSYAVLSIVLTSIGDHSHGALRSRSRRPSFASHGALRSFSHQLYACSHAALWSLSCFFLTIYHAALRSFLRRYAHDRSHAASRLFSCLFNLFSTALRRKEYLTLIPSDASPKQERSSKRAKVVFMPLLRWFSCCFPTVLAPLI